MLQKSSGSLPGETAYIMKQKGIFFGGRGSRNSETLQRIRDEVMNVFRSDYSEVDAKKDWGKNGVYVPSGRIQNDLVNYWLQ